jgi:hypothetical protein
VAKFDDFQKYDRFFVLQVCGKDHWHQTAVTTFTENSPFQDYTRKTALFRATQIFQKPKYDQ